jgi:hypothetical protein
MRSNWLWLGVRLQPYNTIDAREGLVKTVKLLSVSIGFLLLAAALAIADSAASDLTCEVAGRSFVLDESDFRAFHDLGVTPDIFRSYPASSKKREQVCWTRHVARLIAERKVAKQDVDNPLFVIVGLSNEEADKLSDIEAGWIADALITREKKTGSYGPGKD